MAGAALAYGHIASSFVIEREGISGCKGRSGAAFGGSEEADRGPRPAGIRTGIGTKGQQRKDRVIDQSRRGSAERV